MRKERNQQIQAATCAQETIYSFETSGSRQTIQRYKPEDSAFYNVHCFLERKGFECVAVCMMDRFNFRHVRQRGLCDISKHAVLQRKH
jgi:hypothetical protein